MANNIDLLASLESITANSTVETHQGAQGSRLEDPLQIVSAADELFHHFVDVAAYTGAAVQPGADLVTLWHSIDSHGVDELKVLAIVPFVNGIIAWYTETPAPGAIVGNDGDDINSITWAKNWPFILVAPQLTGTNRLQALTHTALDVLDGSDATLPFDGRATPNGTSAVLTDIERVMFRNLDGSAGRVEVIGFK